LSDSLGAKRYAAVGLTRRYSRRAARQKKPNRNGVRAPLAAERRLLVLIDQADYDVKVTSDGSMFMQRWSVSGSTKPTAISADALDQWVTWMVTAGIHQNCDFDGWGAAV
jgi:hypothetical protein